MKTMTQVEKREKKMEAESADESSSSGLQLQLAQQMGNPDWIFY